jgi:hypothetical protein
MVSIKSRIADLEQSSRVTARHQLTDAERAVRLVRILTDPERLSEHAPLREFLKRTLFNNPSVKAMHPHNWYAG